MTDETRPRTVAGACALQSGRDVRILRAVFGVSSRGLAELAECEPISIRSWEYQAELGENARRRLWRAFARLASDRERYAAQDYLEPADFADLDIGIACTHLLASE